MASILKRAYQQQDGGYIRGSNQAMERGVALLRLRDIEPVEEEYPEELSRGGEAGRSVRMRSRLFYLGGDDTGATLMLHYELPGDADPVPYAYYSDGGALERLADTIDGLFSRA